jgi:hypothetical protein
VIAVWLYSLIWMVVIDLAKLVYYRVALDREAHARRLADHLAA